MGQPCDANHRYPRSIRELSRSIVVKCKAYWQQFSCQYGACSQTAYSMSLEHLPTAASTLEFNTDKSVITMTNHTVSVQKTDLESILLIEDDASISNVVKLHLKNTYHVEAALDGAEGYQKALTGDWSVILLDLRLPGKDGLEICRDLRANSVDTPVLMLTSRSGELDRVLGLEMGADDYLVKPFSLLELEARIKALLRRSRVAPAPTGKNTGVLTAADIRLCEKTHQVHKGDELLELTAKEFDLLAHFMRSPTEVFTRAQLLETVWGYGHSGYEHTVNSHINRLRAKVETDPADPQLIVTVWGVGYKFDV